MKVHWTGTAEEHLDAIYAYIARDSETYALRTVDRITNKSKQIGRFPLSGRRVPEYDSNEIREVFVGPYRVICRVGAEQVDVLAVIHGATDIAGRSQDSRNT